ncbi:Secreted seminal-vesicle Ly-6 protein 1 [Camelus dromedarius]|uniref:Secreted seminal-vesicle Ly-6 protein 1 n=1 Tax=Camelus dromedarius TaxID=9838 RepID=A0A5N4C7G9_CAMDR|nr:Secreted seminal-vesicle Ly-6 protein 1 [Camelus dromedarius]
MKLRQGKSRAGQRQLLTQLQQPPVLPLQMPFTRSMFSVVSPGLGVCERFNASGVCETGENFCQTQGSEECFLKKVYEGDTVSYGYQGCSSLCIPMKLFNRITTVEFKCCHDSPLCNKF